MIDHLMTIFAVLESIVILVLCRTRAQSHESVRPVRRAIVCMRSRWGSAIRLFHLADGHTPAGHRCCKWEDSPRCCCHQIGNLWCEDRRKELATIAARRAYHQIGSQQSGTVRAVIYTRLAPCWPSSRRIE